MKGNQAVGWFIVLGVVIVVGTVASWILALMERVPAGTVHAWYPFDERGEPRAVPDGWVVCDGRESVPDLDGRVLVGVAARREATRARAHVATEDDAKQQQHRSDRARPPAGLASTSDAVPDGRAAWNIVFIMKR